jgi:hypothetical protein
MSEADPPPDERTIEELQREKLMLEIEKLRRDILHQQARFDQDRIALEVRLRREGWQLVLGTIGGATAILVAAAGLLKLLQ